jgi:3'-phosphoadenosine 5'-phosphosulfate sulfotransferase (PAPS reductase)/FAD synthetase
VRSKEEVKSVTILEIYSEHILPGKLEELRRALDRSERIVFQFSGGLDSQFAMELVLEMIDGTKEYEALFVNTEAEFPSVVQYVKDYTSKHQIPLTIIDDSVLKHIEKSGHFPHPIYRDCLSIINREVNKYSKRTHSTIVSGHRPLQRGGRSKMDVVYEKRGLLVLSPLYVFDKSFDYTTLYTGERWEGYAKGFSRTACYCCPFQKEQQFEAMRLHESECWHKMKALLETYPIIRLDDRPSGGVSYKNIKPYWEDRYGVKLIVDSTRGKKKVVEE